MSTFGRSKWARWYGYEWEPDFAIRRSLAARPEIKPPHHFHDAEASARPVARALGGNPETQVPALPADLAPVPLDRPGSLPASGDHAVLPRLRSGVRVQGGASYQLVKV